MLTESWNGGGLSWKNFKINIFLSKRGKEPIHFNLVITSIDELRSFFLSTKKLNFTAKKENENEIFLKIYVLDIDLS